jgi:hypothetical protein
LTLACSSNEETDNAKEPIQRRAIIVILKEHQAGMGAKELCRKHGISDRTFIMPLIIDGLSVRLVFNNPTLSENTDGRPQTQLPATAL